MKKLFLTLMAGCLFWPAAAQEILFPVKGLSTNLPKRENVDRFCRFIDQELAPMGLNTLLLRVDYNYQFESYPELANHNALSKAETKKIVEACKRNNIRLIPLMNMVGHQSWAGSAGRLLTVYPEFDETPYIRLPGPDDKPFRRGLYRGDLYCKSYCTLHPDVHQVVFSLLGELIEVYETDAVHAGMDEVFYIGEPGCVRCGGIDKARLFADEVNRINAYVKSMGCELWIWGDRLLDAAETGLGMYEAAENDTAPAIDLADKDVVICDWHYNRAVPTAVYFAHKGFRVASSPWRRHEVALEQLENTVRFRKSSPAVMRDRYLGIMHTDWASPEEFMDQWPAVKAGTTREVRTAPYTFYQLFTRINELEKAL